MNNNRNNNRRRGRGNNRQQGGQQLNRIDSRARGNAPQLLEKYRKLALDAHLNGDRVTEEYYLQFADHYFRVLADQRQRQEDSRQPRREDRPAEYGDDYAEDDYYPEAMPYERAPNQANGNGSANGNYAPAEGRQERGPRPERQDRGDRQDREPRADRQDRQGQDRQGQDRQEREPRADRQDREPRGERGPRAERAPRTEPTPELEAAPEPAAQVAEGDASIYEPVENPFLRESRGPRPARQRKPRRQADADGQDAESQNQAPAASEPAAEQPASFDPASLPPSIGRKDEVAEDAPAKPRRRTRKAAPPADDASGALEVVN